MTAHVCTRCGIEKPDEDFYRDCKPRGTSRADGLQSVCKSCRSEQNTSEEGRRRQREYMRQYRARLRGGG